MDSKNYHILDIPDLSCSQIVKKKGHTNVCFTSIFKVKYRVHVIDVGISEIRTYENITIDTMIKFIACNHPE